MNVTRVIIVINNDTQMYNLLLRCLIQNIRGNKGFHIFVGESHPVWRCFETLI